jgi:hypothetical protein
MSQLEQQDFSGGMTDYINSNDPTKFEKADGFIIDNDNKLKSCPGTTIFETGSYQVANAERIGHLDVYNDKLIVQSSHHLYYPDSTGWLEIKGNESIYNLANQLKTVLNSHYCNITTSIDTYGSFATTSLLFSKNGGSLACTLNGAGHTGGDGFTLGTGRLEIAAGEGEGDWWYKAKYSGDTVYNADPNTGTLMAYICSPSTWSGDYSYPLYLGTFFGPLTSTTHYCMQIRQHVVSDALKLQIYENGTPIVDYSIGTAGTALKTGSLFELSYNFSAIDKYASRVILWIDGVEACDVTGFFFSIPSTENVRFGGATEATGAAAAFVNWVAWKDTAATSSIYVGTGDDDPGVSTYHATADLTNTIEASAATSDSTLITLATELLASYDAHEGDMELSSSWLYHDAKETADHSLTSAVAPTTVAECVTRLNDLQIKFNAHEADSSGHTAQNVNQLDIGAGASNDGLLEITASSYISTDSWQKHLFFANDSFEPIQKLYVENGVYRLLSASLPPLTRTPSLCSGGSSTNTYLYAFYYKQTYTIGDVTYTQYGPITYTSIENVTAPDASNIQISDITFPSSLSNSDNFGDITLVIARTESNGTSYYEVAETRRDFYNDSTVDATLITNDPIYNSGSLEDHEPFPACKYITITNDVMYGGYIKESSLENPNRIRFSIPGILWASPATFYKDLDAAVTGLSNYQGKVLGFTADTLNRLEGYLDSAGDGLVTSTRVSGNVGCISNNSIVKTTEGVYFAAKDGFYLTNGYELKKLSLDLDLTTYKGWTNTAAKRLKIYGTNDAINGFVYWSVVDSGSDNDKIVIYNKRTGGFTTRSNQNHSIVGSSEYTMTPTALLCTDISSTPYGVGSAVVTYDLVIGHTKGYVFRTTSSYDSDLEPLSATYPNTPAQWYRIAIPYNFKSLAFNAGTDLLRKWWSYVKFVFQQSGALNLAVNCYNDLVSTARALISVNVADLSSGIIPIIRKFPAGYLRATKKQIELVVSNELIYQSSDYCTAIISGTTCTLTDTATYDWPSDCRGYTIRFSADSYVTSYNITARAADALTLATAPAAGTYSWQIYGKKTEQPMKILSMVLNFTPMGGKEKDTGESFKAGN